MLKIEKSKRRRRDGPISLLRRFSSRRTSQLLEFTATKTSTRDYSSDSSDLTEEEEQDDELMTFEQFLGINTKNDRLLVSTLYRQELAAIDDKRHKMREKILEEILTTERNYVKTLDDIIQGFKLPFEANPNLTPEQTNRIFGNIEQLRNFQAAFLAELDRANDDCSIPSVFVSWAPRFEIYAEYCNNFCLAQHLLMRMSKLDSFNKFAEQCRQDRGLIRLKLADFLLVPIQRICKYKILLADLLRNTDPAHVDYHISMCALTDIESITKKINESKKKFEETINVNNFQLNIKNWQGRDLSERSFVQVHSGSLRRRLADHGEETEEREVTLFDNQMAICMTSCTGDKVLEERIDLNHVTVIFDDHNRRIKIECHFKKFSRVIELTAEENECYEVWKAKLSFELKFNDINDNKENADHIIGDHTTRTKLRQGSGHRRSPRNSIGHLFETMRKKKPEAYKTL